MSSTKHPDLPLYNNRAAEKTASDSTLLSASVFVRSSLVALRFRLPAHYESTANDGCTRDYQRDLLPAYPRIRSQSDHVRR